MFALRRHHRLVLLLLVVAAATASAAGAALQIGNGGRDVLIGKDNDNAANTFIQPAGVTAKQHLDNTDILRGGPNGDLLIGLKGDDLLEGEQGADILVGGVEQGSQPNSDLIDGDQGDDVNVWAPGDGSDAFIGGRGYDTHISAPIVLAGSVPALFPSGYRQVPHVSIDSKPQFTCTVERVPANLDLGFDYVTRFFANGNLAVTIRLDDVEQVLCPSPNAGRVLVARLSGPSPTFVERPLSDFSGTLLGSILQAPAAR
jgi:Ca2+-binding RTX toxin-like protein